MSAGCCGSSRPVPNLLQTVAQLLETDSNESLWGTELTNNIKRLHELVMVNLSSGEPFVLEHHPAFKKLRATVACFSDTVGARGKQLVESQSAADGTQQTIKDNFSRLRMLMSSPPCGHPKKDGGHPELPLPLFGEELSMALHESGLATLGVGINHGVAVALPTQDVLDASEKLTFEGWWGALQKINTITQWRQKLVSIGAQEADVEHLGL